jgi:manganese oxidase
MMERQHHRVMEQMQRDVDSQRTDGFYSNVNMLHQHGAGNQDILLIGDFIPQRDPLTDVYRPVGRALNYRSEPFGIDNMQTQHEYFAFEDESMAYSAYTFGDPATTVPRSYLGDPAKFRLVHGGSEVFHSHHPHGGSIRWPRSPRAIDEMPLWHAAKNGPVKYPVIRMKSDRVDVEVIGPSETMDLETECGSGLCQQLAGDFLFH